MGIGVETLVNYTGELAGDDGVRYRARARGYRRPDDVWEGDIEFLTPDGAVAHTCHETTQPNLSELVYWAHALTPGYLRDALQRATTRPVRSSGTVPRASVVVGFEDGEDDEDELAFPLVVRRA